MYVFNTEQWAESRDARFHAILDVGSDGPGLRNVPALWRQNEETKMIKCFKLALCQPGGGRMKKQR